MKAIATYQAPSTQHPDPVLEESSSTCDRILKIGETALAALACIVLFILFPLSGALTTIVVLNDYYRNRGQNTFGRNLINGTIAGSVYEALKLLNAQLFAII